MCYACEHPFNASTYEKSVWIQEYRQWAQCDEAEAQSIYDEIVENADEGWEEAYLTETQYCECGEGEECDPEAESDDEEIDTHCDSCGTTCLDHHANKNRGSESPCEECGENRCEHCPCDCEEECDPEADDDEEEFCVKTKLAEYRERIKKVLDTFEIIKADDPANEYDFDLYLDIETGRVFDLEVNEYFL